MKTSMNVTLKDMRADAFNDDCKMVMVLHDFRFRGPRYASDTLKKLFNDYRECQYVKGPYHAYGIPKGHPYISDDLMFQINQSHSKWFVLAYGNLLIECVNALPESLPLSFRLGYINQIKNLQTYAGSIV